MGCRSFDRSAAQRHSPTRSPLRVYAYATSCASRGEEAAEGEAHEPERGVTPDHHLPDALAVRRELLILTTAGREGVLDAHRHGRLPDEALPRAATLAVPPLPVAPLVAPEDVEVGGGHRVGAILLSPRRLEAGGLVSLAGLDDHELVARDLELGEESPRSRLGDERPRAVRRFRLLGHLRRRVAVAALRRLLRLLLPRFRLGPLRALAATAIRLREPFDFASSDHGHVVSPSFFILVFFTIPDCRSGKDRNRRSPAVLPGETAILLDYSAQAGSFLGSNKHKKLPLKTN